MTALAKDTVYNEKGAPGVEAKVVVSGSTCYGGSYMALGHSSHGTSANRGRVFPWAGAVGSIPMGFAQHKVVGDSALEVPIANEGQIKRVPITAAGTIADHGKWVYIGTDDNAFTLTRPTNGAIVGYIRQFISSTEAWVEFFSQREMMIAAMCGWGQDTWFLGVISGVTATGNMLTGIVAPHHAKITAVYGIVIEPITDADQAADINLEIGGTNVTGGVIAWVTADLIGAKLAGSAITAANECHEGDLIDVECVNGTAGTAADGYLGIYATVERLPGV